MEDEELQAIRRARMQQIRGGAGGGGGGGGPPSGNFLNSLGGGGGGGPSRGGGGGDDEESAQQQQQQQQKADEQRRQMLSTILDNDARERLSRISLVKPQKAQGITNLLIQMAQSGQIRQRVNEEQLIGLLEQVERSQGEGAGGSSGKITINRKKQILDDDDDDFDL